MKIITINNDKESVLQEIQMLDGIQVKVPDTMSNEDVEKMLINNVPELHKYDYKIDEGEQVQIISNHHEMVGIEPITPEDTLDFQYMINKVEGKDE